MKRAIVYTDMPEQSDLLKRSKQHLQNRQGHAITISSSIDPQFSSTTAYPGLVGMHPSITSDNLIDTPACAPFVRSVIIERSSSLTPFEPGTILCLKAKAGKPPGHFNADTIYENMLVKDVTDVKTVQPCVVVEPGSLIEGKYNAVSVSFADCTDIQIHTLTNGRELGPLMVPGAQFVVLKGNTIAIHSTSRTPSDVILLFTCIYHNKASGICTACLHELVVK